MPPGPPVRVYGNPLLKWALPGNQEAVDDLVLHHISVFYVPLIWRF